MSSPVFWSLASLSFGVSAVSGPILRLSQSMVDEKERIAAALIFTQLKVIQLSSCAQGSIL